MLGRPTNAQQVVNDAKNIAIFLQLCVTTGLYASFGCAVLGGFTGIVAADSGAAQLPLDGAGRKPKGSCKLWNSELLKTEAIQGHVILVLDLFVVLELDDFYLRTLEGRRVLHLTFKFANKLRDAKLEK